MKKKKKNRTRKPEHKLPTGLHVAVYGFFFFMLVFFQSNFPAGVRDEKTMYFKCNAL